MDKIPLASTRIVVRAVMMLVLAVATQQSNAQSQLFEEAISTYFESAFAVDNYNEVPIAWKMKGTVQAEFNEGLNNLIEGNPSMALTNFDNSLTQDGTLWQAYYYRAVSHKQLKNYTAARSDLQRLIDKNLALYETQIELGKIAFLEKKYDEAERWYEKSIKLSPGKSEPHYLKANVQLAQFQKAKAVKNFNASLERDSLLSNAHVSLAILKMVDKRSKEGMEQLNIVLRYDTLNKHALLFRCLATMGTDKTACLRDANSLVRVMPENLMALFLRGIILSEQGNFDRAFPDFHKIIEATSENDNKYKGKQTWLDKKIDVQNAGAYAVSRVYGLDERDATNLKKAYCQMIVGDYQNSISTVDGMAIASKEPLCLLIKAIDKEHIGKHNEAYTLYDQALKLDNDILDAHKKRGIYEQELKQWNNSIHDFTEVLRLNPETYVVYKWRGVSKYALDRYKDAIADYDRYLSKDTSDLEAVSYRGMAYRKMGKHLQAATDFAVSGTQHLIDLKALSYSIDSLVTTTDTAYTVRYLEKLTMLTPGFSAGYASYIRLLIQQNKWDVVATKVDHALFYNRVDASGATPRSYLLTVKAMTSRRAKRNDEAVTKLNEALKLDKSNALAFFERGKIMLETGKTSKGIADLEKASSLGKKEALEFLNQVAIR